MPTGPLGLAHPKTRGWSHDTRSSGFVLLTTWGLQSHPFLLDASVKGGEEDQRISQTQGLVGGGFPGGSICKESACNAGDPGSVPGSGGSPGEGNGNSLQYFRLGNPMHRGAWLATVHGVAKSRMRLSN